MESRKRPVTESDDLIESLSKSVSELLPGLDDVSWLVSAPKRTCSACNKNYLFYCYECLLPVHPYENSRTKKEDHCIPFLTLPLHVTIYRHHAEPACKATAIATKILAPTTSDVILYDENNIPEYDPATTVLLYPTKDAVDMNDPSLDLLNIRNVIAIESAWGKSGGIARHRSFRNLRRIRLLNYNTMFWRFQNKGDDGLATMEAIYYFLKEYQTCIAAKQQGVCLSVSSDSSATNIGANNLDNNLKIDNNNSNNGMNDNRAKILLNAAKQFYRNEWDNLLFFFIAQYYKIQKYYHESKNSFCKRHAHSSSYIRPLEFLDGIVKNNKNTDRKKAETENE